VTDELMREIERVIFESHPMSERDGAVNFKELLEMRASRFRQAREREEEALADLSERIGVELEKGKLVADLKKQAAEKTKLINAYIRDRDKLVAKGGAAMDHYPNPLKVVLVPLKPIEQPKPRKRN
jgi:hypothetical protein